MRPGRPSLSSAPPTMPAHARGVQAFFNSPWRAAGLYLVLTLLTTWPLVVHVATSLPGDLGDSLLNCWILSWSADHVLAWLGGNLDAFRDYWQAPIFHPSPLALAYSEHLFAQAVQIAPVYALTGNIILSYNLLFLSTFVLSGLGTYLLVRELTEDPLAAWIAGAGYAFALYRLPQVSHLQVLSSQWLPFALYGMRRFFVTRRLRPLAGAVAALIAQNLSCGYHMVYLTPFVGLYCLYELVDRGSWRSLQTWLALGIAATITTLVTWPFVTPYLQLRALGFPARGLDEVINFSADLLAFATASPASRIWGHLDTFPHAEGELFPGLVVPALALAGAAARVRTLARATAGLRAQALWRRVALVSLAATAGAVAILVLIVGVTTDGSWRVAGVMIRLHALWRAGAVAGVLIGLMLALSPRLRAAGRGVPGSALAFFACTVCLSALLSLGPVVRLHGDTTMLPAPYAQLYWHVPGFDGLRVPARYAMLTALALAVMAGYGARALGSRGARGRAVLVVLAAAFVLESTGVPMALDDPLDAAPVQARPRARLCRRRSAGNIPGRGQAAAGIGAD